MEEIMTLPADADAGAGEFELGIVLGSRKAFASVAGRCSAADAECLRRMRENKLYLSRAETWEAFCPQYLGLSKTHANRIIRNLEEFGPDYFEVAQLTRITPEQFRAIAPAIRENNIHVNGQAIALIAENSDRVTAAVAELRRAVDAPAGPSDSAVERLPAWQRRFDRLVDDFQALSRSTSSPAERSRLREILSNARTTLRRLSPPPLE
jgi:hypothetical protein